MFKTGIAATTRGLINRVRFGEIRYKPKNYVTPERMIVSKSMAWAGLERIILDVIQFSGIERNCALEFGVEFGYSTAVLANYFDRVTGIDTFMGDAHAGHYGDIYEETSSNLRDFGNIELIKSDYKDFLRLSTQRYDLIHVDIIHTYEDTFACGLWSAEHSDCTIFHDTQSFPAVKRAVADIAKHTKKKFYNYRDCNGLGIVV